MQTNQIKSPILSIIIPCFNASDVVRRCVQSICNQNYKSFEIIAIDDASIDKTRDILEGIAKTEPRLKCFSNKSNKGQGWSRNFGIKQAKGNIITFVDADDYLINPNYFSKCISVMVKEKVDILFTPAIRKYKEMFRCDQSRPLPSRQREAVANLYLNRFFGTHAAWAKFYSSKVCQESKFIEFGYSQDVLFVLNAILLADSFEFLETEYGYVYSQVEKSTWRSDKITIQQVISSIRLLAEIVSKQSQYPFLALDHFVKTWNIDHGKRIQSYLLQGEVPRYEKKQIGMLLKALGDNYENIIDKIDNKKIKRFFASQKEMIWQENDDLIEVFPGLSKYVEDLAFNQGKNSTSDGNFIISLTSYPARIQMVSKTILSILSQPLPPNTVVVLYLSKVEFSGATDLPDELLSLLKHKEFQIRWVEGNTRSYKKLIPALQDFPNSPILTIDDDIQYPPNFVMSLKNSLDKNPNCIQCHRCRVLRTKKEAFDVYSSFGLLNKEIVDPASNLLFTGVGGVLYPPNALHPLVKNEILFSKLCPNQDDIWFWLMATFNGTLVKKVDNHIQSWCELSSAEKQSLYFSNARGGNDEALRRISIEFPFILDLVYKKPIFIKKEQRWSNTLKEYLLLNLDKQSLIYRVLKKMYYFLNSR